MRQSKVLLTVVGVATLAVGAVSAVPALASGGGGPVAQQILGSGSNTTEVMMQAMDGLYQFSPGCSSIPDPAGPPAWLDFSCQSPDPVATTQPGTSKNGSSTVTMPSTTGVQVGQQVTGPGITAATWPQGVYVGSIKVNVSISLSSSPDSNVAVKADATAGAGTFSFYDITRTENYEHDQLSEAYYLGSSNGIAQLCQKGVAGVANISFARSSRAPKASDCKGLEFVAYARDGITWESFNVAGSGVGSGMSNSTAPCTTSVTYCLTQAQLQGIYVNCTITNWSQVGGANVTINPYTPQPGSGTRSQFDTFLGGSSDTCIQARGAAYAATHIIPENNNTPIVNNGDQANAIFPFSTGVWNTYVKGGQNSLLGAVDGIYGTPTTIQNGTFPYGRYLYNVVCGAADDSQGCSANAAPADQAVLNYVGPEGWICKPQKGVANSTTLTGHVNDPLTGKNYFSEIQSVIKAQGFVPLANGVIGGGDVNSDYCRLFTT
jgi:ABC-type phosphate transport system substrate-binding protein